MSIGPGLAVGAPPAARRDVAPHPYWTLARVWAALHPAQSGHAGGAPFSGAPVDARPVRAISTDTRSVQPGDCFVALRGETFDAHDFLAQAEAAGAAAVVVDRPQAATGLGIPAIVVPDTLRAYGTLAAHWRTVWQGVPHGGVVIGVAGSNGKTSTKELLAAALGEAHVVHATRGNLNNLVGVPATLLAMRPDATVAVVEMGTNSPGEIARLAEIVRPDIAVITSIGEEHLEGLGSVEGVLREEADAATGAQCCIIPADDVAMAERLTRAIRGRASRIVRAGLDAGDVRAERWMIDAQGRGRLVIDGVEIALPVPGVHNLRNAMLVIAVAQALGVSLDQVARGVATMPQPAMRSSLAALGTRGALLLNDAYNANPPSTRAAIDLLGAVAGGAARQRVAVLGTMRELGAHADALHEDVLRHAIASPADVIVAVGDFAAAAQRLAADPSRVLTADAPDAVWPLLAPRLSPDAIILLKASRGVALERLVPALTQWAES
ncbi:MAG: UDP-N-acetylmuramoyl-tripeptide--D-alanyl-D-alanine ligase [Gemmatimonadaceae bacterium]|nr:UDP-N-acetylmuramoyl-tripeptide--D-alanyl-D-alanine ligase [Gemmatimonadaceae bacterium]